MKTTMRKRFIRTIWIIGVLAASMGMGNVARAHLQDSGRGTEPTPVQREIERQRPRLDSIEPEERRDALMRLGNFKRPDASRAAAKGLSDPVPIVRVTAAHAVVSLPSDEAAGLLIPLLRDKTEFVRQEVAYALGDTKSRLAVQPLAEVLLGDKLNSVRGAAAVALGRLADESAVVSLAQVLTGSYPKKGKNSVDAFILRAAAHSLGQIKSKAGVPALIEALRNEQNETDVRREAAIALGAIGDVSAAPALQSAAASSDPYLARVALVSLHALAGVKE